VARGADGRRADIVQFWHTVEMFSPQQVERVSHEKRVYAVRPGELLPWEPGHVLSQRQLHPNQAWRHVVYLGVYQVDQVFEVLSRVFQPDGDSYDDRPTGESAVAAFVVSEDGQAIVDSAVLSSCAWATGQALREKPDPRSWLADFDDSAEDFRLALQDVVTEEPLTPDEGSSARIPRILDGGDLVECLAMAVAAAGVSTVLSCGEIRVSSQIVARRKADTTNGVDFLNSFIMGDLSRVAEHAGKGDLGSALLEYLRPGAEIQVDRRVDVRADNGAVLTATSPYTVPGGRWPSNPNHALALNQQLAVCTAVDMADTGIMGVNGPPGTGKTTMLRDLIAALVVARAARLAGLSDPHKAFTTTTMKWQTQDRTRVISQWRPDLTGFEIVVASANNGAVQNVTDEIPAAGAIDESWRERAEEVDYFQEIATALLAPEPDAEARPPSSTSAPGWALVAARLGNKANRSRFADRFWYHKPDEETDAHVWWGLNSILDDYRQSVPDQPWSAAVEQFRTAETRVDAIRERRVGLYQAFERRGWIDSERTQFQRAVSDAQEAVARAYQQREIALHDEREQEIEAERVAQERHAEAVQAARDRRTFAESIVGMRRVALATVQERRAKAEQVVRSKEDAVNRCWRKHAEHQRRQPGLWERTRTFGGAGRRWSQEDEWLTDDLQMARQELATAQQQLDVIQRELVGAQGAVDAAEHQLIEIQRLLAGGVPKPVINHPPLVAARRKVAQAEEQITDALRTQDSAESDLRTCEREIEALDNLLAGAAEALGKHQPDRAWWDDRERREMAALWTDKEWNEARSELFLAALALHKAFLRHTAQTMRRNLQAAMDVIAGDVPAEASAEAVLAAWQSLFFVVPVVSTTFASYGRLFSHLGREALGWLLIDEAGQATPQNAVGALWRTRRAVVVGDPLQLEPVTTLPFRAEQAIRNEWRVDEQWLTSRTSVQRLADRLTTLGTWLPGDSDKTWVGVPLTVHRRCDQPMFDIVNAVAYDGLMIDGTGKGPGEQFATAYPTLPASKWIDVVGSGAQGHWVPDEGRQLDRILATLADLDFDMSEVMVIGPFKDIARQVTGRSRRYPGLKAGTIHTAQGKQADIVILVLGTEPHSVGARHWASAKPNLLNVAVSRAKRRLYVIGDRKAWSSCRHFTILATQLPSSPPR
jgi:hypothetical protein